MKKRSKVMFTALVVLVLMLVASVGVIGSGAFFNNQEKISNNNFVAGKLDLELGTGATLPFVLSNVVPGQSGSGKITITNTAGSIPGKLSVNLVKTIDEENDMIEPETKPVVGKTSDYAGNGGELDMFLQFASFIDVNKNGVFDAGDYQLTYDGQQKVYPGFWDKEFHYSGLNTMLSAWNDVLTLNGSDSVDLVIMWQFPTESQDGNYLQNIAMTDSLGFDINFVLNQVY